MHRHTCFLLFFGIVVSSTMLVSPCRAQTATNSIDNSGDKTLQTPQSASKTDINNPDKSSIPSDTVSQASTEKAVTSASNPRIPIASRIFPSMQQ
jgi:hypothetical protein